MIPLTFRVVGLPKTQGSAQPFKDKQGRARVRDSGGTALTAWRNDVAQACMTAVEQAGGMVLVGPVELQAIYRLPMPKSRPRWAQEAGCLLSSVKPDLDKLTRAIGDSCKAAGALGDDAQIAAHRTVKIEVTAPQWIGVSVRLVQLDPASSLAYVRALIAEVK